MRTLSQYVWAVHGSPKNESCVSVSGYCYLCGGNLERGMPVIDWMPDTFNDQWRARNQSSPYCCEACVYITARKSPVLGRPPKDGSEQGANFRNVSHAIEFSGISYRYGNFSKGEKPKIRAFLERDHVGIWAAAIGDTGQKHTLPFAPLNGPGRSGSVCFEDALVQVPGDVCLVAEMIALLTAGSTKVEIESGNYTGNSWRRCERQIREFEERNRNARGSGWFSLAIWLAQRDEEQVQARLEREKEARGAKRNGKGIASRDGQRPSGLERSVHTDGWSLTDETLAAFRAETAAESERRSDNGPVAREDASVARDRKHEQLALFGDGGARQVSRTK